MRPTHCPATGYPIVTDAEAERRYRELKYGERGMERRQQWQQEGQYERTATRRDVVDRRMDVKRALSQKNERGTGGREGGLWGENDDEVRDGFDRLELETRAWMSSAVRKRVEGWIERCRREGCVGFVGRQGEGGRYMDDGVAGMRNRAVREAGDESEGQSEGIIYGDAEEKEEKRLDMRYVDREGYA